MQADRCRPATRTSPRRRSSASRTRAGPRRTCRWRSSTCPFDIIVGQGHPNSISILPGRRAAALARLRPARERRPARQAAGEPELPRRRSPTATGSSRRVRLAREIFATRAFSDWVGDELMPGPDVGSSDDDLNAFVTASADSYHHQAGSCKMGLDELAVVDPELRVHGVEGLRVADASVMPAVPSGNCHAGIVMIAERVRGHDQDDARPPPRGRRDRCGSRPMSLAGKKIARPDRGRLLRARDLVLPAPVPRGGRRGALPHAALGPGAAHVRRPRVEGAVRGRRELRGHGRRRRCGATTR